MRRDASQIEMGYIRLMWLRSALTSLLAVIVLCVSCAAATCAINCEMSALQPTGHSLHHHHSVAISESVPDHCGHVAVPQSKSEMALAIHDVHVGQHCDGKVCNLDQVEALRNVGYLLDQPSAMMTSTIAAPSAQVVSRLPNYGVADLLPKPPPRHFDILRL